jgi:hypothetical protein
MSSKEVNFLSVFKFLRQFNLFPGKKQIIAHKSTRLCLSKKYPPVLAFLLKVLGNEKKGGGGGGGGKSGINQ